MNVVHPEYLPDPGRSREEMEVLQRDIAADAEFEDDVDFDSADVALSGTPTEHEVGQTELDASSATDTPVVVGVDQAFTDDEAVSAVVAIRDGVVVDRAAGHAPLEIPYIPGLLSFREGSAIVDALESLSVDPDVLVVDGSGRIHFRQAGLATHVGVLFDVPAVGVAKNLLCGTPRASLDDPLAAGARVAIEADDSMDAPDGTVVGYAYQSRQYPNPETRHVNPLFVSPGHRLSAETAVDVVEATCSGYKLPEPTRLADAYADELKA
ncbi:endonuclease V [Halobacterium zhouii]|uniref:endonuclease V n=1 Tax=Halobacterium zhouii TaxID=2902624 RepID=UPI001E39C6EE|nr:endonuclease V [Halobacterium zhouii]